MTIKELMENIDFDCFDKNDMTKKNIFDHAEMSEMSEYINSIKKLYEVDLLFQKRLRNIYVTVDHLKESV